MKTFELLLKSANDFHRLPLKVVGLAALLTLTACTSAGLPKNEAAKSANRTSSLASASTLASEGDLQVVEILPPPLSGGLTTDPKISENDLLEIDVFQVDDLDRTVRVEANGTISLPLVGTVKAAGLTLAELERSLERSYGRNYLQSPEITVFMKESAGQRVTMDGQFVKPGIYPINSQSGLLQTVAQAGGFTDLADESKVFVYRTYPNGKKVAQYSVTDIRKGTRRDPRIYGGDVIVAFASGTKIATKNLREALGIASSAARVAVPF